MEKKQDHGDHSDSRIKDDAPGNTKLVSVPVETIKTIQDQLYQLNRAVQALSVRAFPNKVVQYGEHQHKASEERVEMILQQFA